MKIKGSTKVILVKSAVLLTVSIGVGAVATAAIKNVVPVEGLTKVNKFFIGLGTAVIAGVAAEAGVEYVGEIFDMLSAPFITEETKKEVARVL